MLYIEEIIRSNYTILKDNTKFPPAGQKGIDIAPMPQTPVDKFIADTSLLAEILLQKYEYHIPFYRYLYTNQYYFKEYLQCNGFVGHETAFKTNPVCGCSIVWCISIVILNRSLMKTEG